MFSPEKILGGLIRSSTRGSRKGLGGLVSGGAALGALGVAMETIVAGVNSPELARQVYTASLMAMEVDTDKEREYMNTLASRLELDESTVEQIQKSLKLT